MPIISWNSFYNCRNNSYNYGKSSYIEWVLNYKNDYNNRGNRSYAIVINVTVYYDNDYHNRLVAISIVMVTILLW